MKNVKTVTRQELKQSIDSGENIAIVEALPEQSFQEGHIPGAIRLQADKVKTEAESLLPDKQQKIITYCGGISCNASKKTAEALTELGYANVSAYEAGKEDWTNAGLPLEGAKAGGQRRTASA